MDLPFHTHQRPLRLRIVSDGTAMSTYVVDADTGARLWGVASIDLHIDLSSTPTATLVVRNVEVDIVTASE